ncbi:MAG: sugar ABC transporter permease [Spirochaetales bacterium]|nr:sugar ABC transporter permease [Spirochaetales bacterium]
MTDTIRHRAAKVFRRNGAGWLLMLPGIILFGFFAWVPLLESIRLSLYNVQGITLQDFAGLSHYVSVFRHPDFVAAVRNTFSYTLWSLVIGFPVPIIMALIISELRRGKSLFKVGIYLPNIVPGMAMVLMFSFIFIPGETGVLNIIRDRLGAEPFGWLTNPKWTIPLIVMALTWKGAGATALLYIAGLQTIDSQLYDAAIIDGAGIGRRIFHVTLPGLYNLMRILLILQVISVFQILYEPLVMTNGGPNNASLSLMQLMFRYAFTDYNYSLASAVSVIICLMLIILTVLYMKMNKEQDA